MLDDLEDKARQRLLSSGADCELQQTTNGNHRSISNGRFISLNRKQQQSDRRTIPNTKHRLMSEQFSLSSLFISILLPLILVFLLPSLSRTGLNVEEEPEKNLQIGDNQLTGRLLLTLIRLPFDRLRLSSGMMMLASAKETNLLTKIQQGPSTSADLQEEETQLLMLAPEHRSSHQEQGYQLVQPARVHPGATGAASAPAAHHYQATGSSGDQSDLYNSGDYSGSGGAQSANMVEGPTGAAQSDQSADQAGEVLPVNGLSGSASGSSSMQQTRTDLPSVRALNVKCEKNHMTVNIVFDRPFYGLVFSKGHYNDQKCVHLPPNSGQSSVNFDIHLGKCGMSSSDANGAPTAIQSAASNQQQPNGLFIENTIIIQYDPQVQEIYDQARRLRCTWYDYYEKSVTFRPYNVDMLDAVTANFLGDNIQCWMQIQVGKGPWSSEVAGIVKIGQTMTMVLAIKDDENRFDMLVRNCFASDGKHQPIQLVDEYGCVARPKIMSKFQKVRNFGPAATVVSYAYFQAFKFPDSMSVHFQCVIQVCRHECPEPVCSAASGGDPTSAGSIAGPPGGSDYTASGTEIVASKEPFPNGLRANLSGNGHLLAGSSVNLKLDESQGRVQVKLDTSMMANSPSGRTGSSGGPLPPHLLLANSQQQASEPVSQPNYATPGGRGGHTYMSSSYYRPSTAGAASSVPSSTMTRPLRPATSVSIAPPSGHHSQYSSPSHFQQSSGLHNHHHHHQPRPAYMISNRLGELAQDELVSGTEEEEEGNKLSFIASPRALRSAIPTLPIPPALNHRYRRSINATVRIPRQPQDSTAIKTQKTIQVVSPDDVAFNLLDLSNDESSDAIFPHFRSSSSQAKNEQKQQSMVCFSAARFALSALASFLVMAALVLTAAFVIIRQRSKLDEKLSPVYDSSADLMNQQQQVHPMRTTASNSQQKRRQQQEEMIMRRQREELHQRDTYLARLYSQFVPATYWR